MEAIVRAGSTKSPRDTALGAHEFTSAAGEHICLVVETMGKGGKESSMVEKECMAAVQQALVDSEGDPAERLDSALKELNGLLKAFLVSKAIDDVHMLVAILSPDGQLHVSSAGRAEAYLIRRGTASQITEYTSGKPTPAFVHISSGTVESRDSVVFCTQRLLRALTPAQLAQSVQHQERAVESIIRALEAEHEHGAIAFLRLESAHAEAPAAAPARTRSSRRSAPADTDWTNLAPVAAAGGLWEKAVGAMRGLRLPDIAKVRAAKEAAAGFLSDLTNPQHRRKAHLLLLAGSMSALLVVWVAVHLFTMSERSKTNSELEKLVGQISSQIQAADSRRLIGDVAAANEILTQAEEEAKKVMDTESSTFRQQGLDLLDAIHSKYAEVNNIIRVVPPTMLANLASRNADVSARGLINMGQGELYVFDAQNAYRVLQNSVETPTQVAGADGETISDAAALERFQTAAFLLSTGGVAELTDGRIAPMKTDDAAGWVRGVAMQAYLRYLYILSPEQKQIYKYERLTNRYGPPVGYNVNGDLTGAIDMTIDSNIYVLKEGGSVVKLYRGEVQPFVVRRAPDGVFAGVTKLTKAPNGNFYFLDPVNHRVIVTSDGGATGESVYLRQYVLEGEQVGELKDLVVDGDDTRLYVIDDKRLYVIDLTQR